MKDKAVAFIRLNGWFESTLVGHGAYNGYVAVPPTNKYHGKSYWVIKDVDVHGGITFSEPVTNGEKSFMTQREYRPECVGIRNILLEDAEFITDNTEIGDDWWIFGFDTFHYGDNEYNWGKQAVIQETMNLMKQLCHTT